METHILASKSIADAGLFQLRNIVRENHETTKKKFIWFGEEKEYKFDTPALIITQEGAQEKSANAYLKYPITPNAILEFVAKNRRLLKEPNPGYGLEFDEDIVEDKEPFVLEEKFWDLSQNMKIIDYVSAKCCVFDRE